MSALPNTKSEESAHYKQTKAFEKIDEALAQYFEMLGVRNYNHRFIKYIIAEQLNDIDVPIEHELGDNCDPNDCAYTWMNNDTPFPIPSYLIIPDEQIETFIFYILQYCFKHKQCPTEQYIRQYVAPKIQRCVIVDDLRSFLNMFSVSEFCDFFVTEQIDGVTDQQTIAICDDDNCTYVSQSDDKTDFAMVLQPLIELQLERSIQAWNSHSKRYYVDFKAMKYVFFVDNINGSYFKNHSRKEFMNLLKARLGTPKAVSTRIWNDFKMFVFMEHKQDSDDQYDEYNPFVFI